MNADYLLLFKLLLTPVLITLTSFASRRWGPSIGGWLVGLPLTSGPIALFLALEQGPSFAASAAIGTMLGAATQAAFCVAYALAAKRNRSWAIALLAGTFGFIVATELAHSLTLPLLPMYGIVLLCLMLSLFVVVLEHDAAAVSAIPPRWDLPARIGIATTYVLLLTGLAPWLGPRLTGLLSPYPLYGAIFAAFAHIQLGSSAAIRVLRGLLYGLFGFASFFLVESLLIEKAGIGAAFLAAIATALCFQGLTLWLLQRTRKRSP